MVNQSWTTESDAHADNPYRVLPQVSTLLETLDAGHLTPELRASVVREELHRVRLEIEAGQRPTAADIRHRCQHRVDTLKTDRFDDVINGTGVILHTNLGRAPVSEATAAAMARAANSYVSLEIDPETNLRGGRMDIISGMMRALAGAEATLVVNNNAAAVLLALAALCAHREVVVSRGEAVEIGGGFRIPEVIAQSGCHMVEVGTTNRTYASDFARATSELTGALLKVHPSNFTIEGFVASPSTAELAMVASERGTILIEDLGSGALVDTAAFGLRPEPTVQSVLAAGATIVTFSGDKLMGGPQAGLICGREDVVRAIERHPLARAMRVDKTTLAGIAATLSHYLAGDAESEIPVWRMMSTKVQALHERATIIGSVVGGAVVDSTASVGGGSLPGETLPSFAVELTTTDADGLARRLRTGSPRVFPIIRDGHVLIDLRTVQARQDESLAQAIVRARDQFNRDTIAAS